MASNDKGLEEIPEGRIARTHLRQNVQQQLIRMCSVGQIESNYDETVDSFDTMSLKPELLRGV